jgi:membrane-associated PAP2 superfamily phosphatase
MALLIFALIAGFVVCSVFLAQLGLFPWLAVLLAIPISYAVGYALSRMLRGAGVL